jgi:hypothetical protein
MEFLILGFLLVPLVLCIGAWILALIRDYHDHHTRL